MSEHETTAVALQEDKPLQPQEIMAQINLIQGIMKEAMKEGEHYGKIPGCGDKPCLLKPGAEKLMLTFRLVPDPEVQVVQHEGGQREYRVKLKLYTRNGRYMGAGIGSCSTLETKYRFKRHGETKVETNPADFYNTCEKMAKKRALVDACLTVLAASDIFTQDLDEIGDQVANNKPQQEAEEDPAKARKVLGEFLLKNHSNDKKAASDYLASFSKQHFGKAYTSMSELTAKQAWKLYYEAKKVLEPPDKGA